MNRFFLIVNHLFYPWDISNLVMWIIFCLLVIQCQVQSANILCRIFVLGSQSKIGF